LAATRQRKNPKLGGGGRVGRAEQALSVDQAPGPDATDAVLFTLRLPRALDPERIALLANNTVRLGTSASVTTASGSPAAAVNIGRETTDLGAKSRSGEWWSEAPIILRAGAHAEGPVTSASTVTLHGGASVSGPVEEGADLEPYAETSWTVFFPPLSGHNDLEVSPARTRTLAPDVYGKVTVQPEASLSLTTGTYFFDTFTLNALATLSLDDSKGPVIIYVRSLLALRGQIHGTGAVPNVLFAYAGEEPLLITAPFGGHLIAPNARLQLAESSDGVHAGSFFVKDLVVAPRTKIVHQPFAHWEDVIHGPAEIQLEWADAPVTLKPILFYEPELSHEDAHVSLSEPIFFHIPDEIPVIAGNAGNGVVRFTYVDASGTPVECIYRGGSDETSPTSPLEVAKGFRYVFESCSNGLVAGDRDQGSDFRLHIESGDPAHPHGQVRVELTVGGGCNGTLGQPIPAHESIAIRNAFSWQNTQALTEYDGEGRPLLYYALIYVRDHEQLEALDELYIHWSGKPLFESEMARFQGKCGTLSYDGDGSGIFVYAVLPGVTYNLIREAALNPDPVEGDRTLYEVIQLVDPPETALGPDGSLSYDALEAAAFYYMNLDSFPEDDDVEVHQNPFWNRIKRAAVRAVASVARGVARVVTNGLGKIDRFVQGEVTITLDVSILNRDPSFDVWRPMVRGWGPDVGQELRLNGTRVEVRQWAQRVYTLGIPLPTQFYGTLGSGGQPGRVGIRVAKDTSARSGGVCVEAKNDAGLVTSFILANEVCDFRGLYFGGFSRDRTVEVRANPRDLHALNQVTDGHDYLRTVASYTPHRAEVLTGALGSAMAGWPAQGKVYAPCFGFPNASHDLITGALSGALFAFLGPAGFAVGEVIGALTAVDIVMPPHIDTATDSRGVMTHEYGHFALCSMTFRANSLALSGIIVDTILAGSEIDPDDDVRILNEGFADFFAGQVVSGVNYFRFPPGISQLGMSYCASNPGAVPCLDRNANGTDGSGGLPRMEDDDGNLRHGHMAIARAATLFHDAFDGRNWRGQGVPTNGDAWTSVAGTIEYTGTSTSDQRDESVVLPGAALRHWFDRWQDRGFWLTQDNFLRGLADVASENGVTWCDACDLFALHSPSIEEWQPNGWVSVGDRWQLCTQDPIRKWIGSPPEASLNMRADQCVPCPGHSISNPLGTCQACSDGEIAIDNQCVACPAGSIPRADRVLGVTVRLNQCVPCPETHVWTGPGQCTECAAGQVADHTTNTCIDCAVDLTVDLEGAATSHCVWNVTTIGPAPFGGPNSCGSVHIVDYVGLESIVACENSEVSLEVDGSSLERDRASCEAATMIVDIEQHGPEGWAPVASVGVTGLWTNCAEEPPDWFCTACLLRTDHVVPVSQLVGLDRLRVTARTTEQVAFGLKSGRVIPH
jgi:hypothetical protein